MSGSRRRSSGTAHQEASGGAGWPDASRRHFLKSVGRVGVACSATGALASHAAGAERTPVNGDTMGVLVDIPNCVGCRKCEFACQETAGFAVPPMESFEDKSVMAAARRPQPGSYTVVNQYKRPDGRGEQPEPGPEPTYVKINCLHCLDPACMSACLVGAFSKRAAGPVVYDAWKCMGCRYCMVACPFQIPTYDYDRPLTPQVRKCNLCAHRVPGEEPVPACVKICPQQCLTYGKRDELLVLAHEKIGKQPDKYLDHVYGEHEVGGTSWLYLSDRPFEELGFLKLGSLAPPRITESIQHAVFKHWVPPVAWAGLLGAIMWLTRREEQSGHTVEPPPGQAESKRRRATREHEEEAIPVAGTEGVAV